MRRTLWPRIQRDAADDDCRTDDIRYGYSLAKHKVREQEAKHHGRALEHVGQAHVHPLDNLLPQHRVDSEHAHRAGEERDVPRREELPLRRKLREHPRRGVYEERANQGYVFKDGYHLMGNIDNTPCRNRRSRENGQQKANSTGHFLQNNQNCPLLLDNIQFMEQWHFLGTLTALQSSFF